MTKTTKLAAGLALITGVGAAAENAPHAQLSNGVVRLRLYLPDAQTGFYRGTRFDWSGVIEDLEFAGHNYFPRWFQRTDPKVHDFIYDGDAIVASPCTSVTGPAEEFSTDGKALGFDEAKPGGTFLKIGVGVLRRPDQKPYDAYHLYDIVDGGKWTVQTHPDRAEFRQLVADQASGYGYDYRKTVALRKDQPRLVLEHTLRNSGQRAFQTSVYNHNFLYLDRQPPGPGTTLTLPFQIQASPQPDQNLAQVQGNRILFRKTLAGEESVYMAITGFGTGASDYDIRIENRRLGAGLHIVGNQPLSRVSLWSIRAPLSLEPFNHMALEPGAEFSWQIEYEFYTLPPGKGE